MARILIVEDHPVVREGYAALFDAEPDLTICGETGSAQDAMQLVRETEPDLVIADLSLEGKSGLSLTRDLSAIDPALPIVVVSTHDEELYATRALEAGAHAYLMKSEADTMIVRAIREVLAGGVWVSADVKTTMLLHMATGRASPASTSDEGSDDSFLDALSDRELEVLWLLGRGHTRKEIADVLGLSPKTIDSHRAQLKEKLSVDTNDRLRRFAAVWVELDRRPEDLSEKS